DLLLTRIRRNDAIEHRRQSYCRLAVSSAAIPRQLPTWRDAAQILEHLLRVTRPKLRVIRCLLRKVILEAHAPTVIRARSSCNGCEATARLSNLWFPVSN